PIQRHTLSLATRTSPAFWPRLAWCDAPLQPHHEERGMSKLLIRPKPGKGLVSRVTPESAGWTYVGFDLYRLDAGDTVSAETGKREICLVFVTGKGKTSAGGQEFGVLGARMSPFDGKPCPVYVPEGTDWSVTAETVLELAVCSAPGLGGGLPARV